MKFSQKLDQAIIDNNSLLCVGLDPDMDKIPAGFKAEEHPLFEFNKAIIDATHDLVCAYKPNSAFYEALGDFGVHQLKLTVEYIQTYHEHCPVILDAKRGDIDSTNNGYSDFAFDYLNVDAITLQPYLGSEALQPFLNHSDKGCIILCRTSNKGAGEFQDLVIANEAKQSQPLYLEVAKQVSTSWNTNNNCMLVVGATYPEELKKIREVVPDMFFLVPGIGTQGGDIEATLGNGLRKDKSGLIISSSRAILYASSDEDFAEKAREKAMATRDELNKYR